MTRNAKKFKIGVTNKDTVVLHKLSESYFTKYSFKEIVLTSHCGQIHIAITGIMLGMG